MTTTGVALAVAVTFYWFIPLQPVAEGIVSTILILLLIFSALKIAIYLRAYHSRNGILYIYNSGLAQLEPVISGGTSLSLRSALDKLKSEKNILLNSLLAEKKDYFDQLIELRHRQEFDARLQHEVELFRKKYQEKAIEYRNQHPLYKAFFAIESAEAYLKGRRAELDAQWKIAYMNFSWWNKLKYGDSPDFRELDKKIADLDTSKFLLLSRHKSDFNNLKAYYKDLAEKAFIRVTQSVTDIETYIRQSRYDDIVGKDLLKKGFLLAAMTVPVSIWNDVNSAGDVFDVLRSVNGNYAGLTDTEIWWETVFLPSESLAGLISLTKGAYLESLVAADTGGQLFEHFNHANTDIMIDGVAYQVKATDSADYINSVVEGVPVIATSEVAATTDAIDSGYSNAQLQEVVSLAVGGSVIDAGDTAVDAILTGVGGLGVFATLSGINHVTEKYNNGGDLVEAMFEGVGVAVEGTARAAVNMMEMSYKALNSRPSRFIGRTLVKGFVALDKKLSSAEQPPKRK